MWLFDKKWYTVKYSEGAEYREQIFENKRSAQLFYDEQKAMGCQMLSKRP